MYMQGAAKEMELCGVIFSDRRKTASFMEGHSFHESLLHM